MQLHGRLLTLYMSLLPWEICMVMYIKKKKETSHDIQCGKWQRLFATDSKRANQVSSFDTNMKPTIENNFFFNPLSPNSV